MTRPRAYGIKMVVTTSITGYVSESELELRAKWALARPESRSQKTHCCHLSLPREEREDEKGEKEGEVKGMPQNLFSNQWIMNRSFQRSSISSSLLKFSGSLS